MDDFLLAVADNTDEFTSRKEVVSVVEPDEIDEKAVIIDVRSPGEYDEGHIPGAINIPWVDFLDKVTEIAKTVEGQDVVVHCEYCQDRGPACATALLEYHPDTKIVKGGYNNWRFVKNVKKGQFGFRGEGAVDVVDFLPKYPQIIPSKHDVLNPYDGKFAESIFKKNEFYENKLERIEQFPKERGMLMKHQKNFSRYMSSHTPYDQILAVHQMGTGKTCSAIGAIEDIKSEHSSIKGAIVLAKGENLLNNFINELVTKCTPGYYIPENYEKLTELEKIHRINKKIRDFYQFRTFTKFAKHVKGMSDADITDEFSNMIIVIDEVHNLRIQQDKKKDTLEIYQIFNRFLHLLKNSKVIMLSGTPMKDNPAEIASVMNLILPKELQLPLEDEFLKEYMKMDNNVYKVRKSKVNALKERFKGRVSFLREMTSTVKRTYVGEKKIGSLKHLIVNPLKMSKFQSKSYAEAYELDHAGKKGVYINSREAALFVYPDGSWGRKGFEKYIKSKKGQSFSVASKGGARKMHTNNYSMDKEMVKLLKGKTDEETIENIRKHSATYAMAIQEIITTDGKTFDYSSIARGSGAILFSLLLELFGFSKATGGEKTPALRYAILTNKTASPNDLKRITKRCNKVDNMKGEFIKVIIGSKAISEGFSFYDIVLEIVNTPHWNYSEIRQALARGIRLGSHNNLIKAGENPNVRIIQPVAIPREKEGRRGVKSIDLMMYEISEDKDISIRSILRLIMESAFDCALNYQRNHLTGFDNQRECEYTSCDYECDGIDMDIVRKGLNDSELDYSTYQLYYANPRVSAVRRKIESLFRENTRMDLQSIIQNLEGKFTSEEIENALFTLRDEESGERYTYRMFKNYYSVGSVKKIINIVENLFQDNFRLSIHSIIDAVSTYDEEVTYTKFEIISALSEMINNNWIITNRYGLPAYLKEENNMYFLVNSMGGDASYFNSYYTMNPTVKDSFTPEQISEYINSESLPRIIRMICKVEDQKEFTRLIKTLPKGVQEFFIEASVLAESKGIQKNVEIREFILQHFQNYIKKVGKTHISTLPERARCLDESAVWSECTDEQLGKLAKSEEKKSKKLREDNPYGIIGKYNPENNAFCIVDLDKEKGALVKATGKSVDTDKRIVHTGKVCSDGGWKLPQLLEIAVRRLKIPAPDNYRKSDSKKEMIAIANKEKRLMKVYDDVDLSSLSKNELRSALYWGTPKKLGGVMGIKTICGGVRKWLDENGYMEIDNQCGVQGKKKVKTTTMKKETVYRLHEFRPIDDSSVLKAIKNDLKKMMSDCFKIDNYELEIDDKKWVVIYSRKNIVGFVVLGDNDEIYRACIAKNYRRSGIPKKAIRQALSSVCSTQKPTVKVNNKINAKAIIRMYKSYGFEISKSNEDFTWMVLNCEE